MTSCRDRLIEEFPRLHRLVLTEYQWWGCLEPERPYDWNEVWDERCEKCRIKMRLVLATHGDIAIFDPIGFKSRGPLSVILEKHS